MLIVCNRSLIRDFNSRPSRSPGWDYDFFVDFDAEDSEQLSRIMKELGKVTKQVKAVSTKNTEVTNGK